MKIWTKGILTAVFAGMILSVVLSCMFGTVKMTGPSMEPSISDGSIIFVNKLAYFYQKPEAGDVVTFRCNVYSEDGEGNILVRRIAATGGDRVRITDGNLYVNDEPYKTEQNIYLEPMEEITIGTDSVFVLSDSLTAVLDSRNQAVGQLRTDELNGKVCFR